MAMKWGALLLALGVGFCGIVRTAQAQVAPDGGHKAYEWDHMFPIWGKRLAARGMTFPKPWGVGANYAYADQQVLITDVNVAVNDGDFVNLDDVLVFDSVRSQVHVTNLRGDLWLFPFLNVYLLGNYVIESQTQTTISEPFAFQAGANQPGAGGGFGTTLAFGFAGFFGTLDLNFTWNKMEKLADPVSTILFTPRVGRNFGKVGPVNLTLWVGAMRQQIGSSTLGAIRLRDTISGPSDEFLGQVQDWYDGLGPVRQAAFEQLVEGLQGVDPTIHYRLEKHLAHQWNMTIGTDIGLTDNFFVRMEVGFIERTQFIGGINYRFDGMPVKKKKAKQAAAAPSFSPLSAAF